MSHWRFGKAVVQGDGKRGVDAEGKGRVFDTDGNCVNCCDCWLCDPGTTPETMELVLSGFEFCCHYIVYGTAGLHSDPDGFLSAPITLTRITNEGQGKSCWWRTTFNLTRTLTIASYDPPNECAGSYISSSERACEIILNKLTSTSWELMIREIAALGGTHFFYDLLTGEPENDCSSVLVFTNDYGPCYEDNEHTFPIGANGTATVTPV